MAASGQGWICGGSGTQGAVSGYGGALGGGGAELHREGALCKVPEVEMSPGSKDWPAQGWLESLICESLAVPKVSQGPWGPRATGLLSREWCGPVQTWAGPLVACEAGPGAGPKVRLEQPCRCLRLVTLERYSSQQGWAHPRGPTPAMAPPYAQAAWASSLSPRCPVLAPLSSPLPGVKSRLSAGHICRLGA